MVMQFGKELGLDGSLPCWLHQDAKGRPAPGTDPERTLRTWQTEAARAGLPLVVIHVRHHHGCKTLNLNRRWGRRCTCVEKPVLLIVQRIDEGDQNTQESEQ
jgi:hypothetical protein